MRNLSRLSFQQPNITAQVAPSFLAMYRATLPSVGLVATTASLAYHAATSYSASCRPRSVTCPSSALDGGAVRCAVVTLAKSKKMRVMITGFIVFPFQRSHRTVELTRRRESKHPSPHQVS